MSFVEDIQKISNAGGVMLYLEIWSSGFEGTLRLVNDTRDWTLNGVSYTGFPFKFTPPDDSDSGTEEATLVIDNIGREILQSVEELGPNTVIMAKIMMTSRSDPSNIFYTFSIPMTSLTVDQSTITAKCGYKYITSQRSVKKTFNKNTAPGIF